MTKGRRRNYQLGGSKAMTYPGGVDVGEEASVVGDRLLLIDPRGEIDPDDLVEFMVEHVEPAFWKWWRPKQAAKRAGVKAMQAETPMAEEAQPAETQTVIPGPQVRLVNCWRCSGQIAWRLDLGRQGLCPYCGAGLQVVI